MILSSIWLVWLSDVWRIGIWTRTHVGNTSSVIRLNESLITFQISVLTIILIISGTSDNFSDSCGTWSTIIQDGISPIDFPRLKDDILTTENAESNLGLSRLEWDIKSMSLDAKNVSKDNSRPILLDQWYISAQEKDVDEFAVKNPSIISLIPDQQIGRRLKKKIYKIINPEALSYLILLSG